MQKDLIENPKFKVGDHVSINWTPELKKSLGREPLFSELSGVINGVMPDSVLELEEFIERMYTVATWENPLAEIPFYESQLY